MIKANLVEVDPRTGIDTDIMHKYAVFGLIYYVSGMPGVRKLLKENPDRTYSTHYQSVEKSVLATHNQDRINMLDALSKETYETLVNNNGPEEDLIEIIRKAYRIIYGRELGNLYFIETFPKTNFQLQFEY